MNFITEHWEYFAIMFLACVVVHHRIRIEFWTGQTLRYEKEAQTWRTAYYVQNNKNPASTYPGEPIFEKTGKTERNEITITAQGEQP